MLRTHYTIKQRKELHTHKQVQDFIYQVKKRKDIEIVIHQIKWISAC